MENKLNVENATTKYKLVNLGLLSKSMTHKEDAANKDKLPVKLVN